jgi:hypothetical protein
MQANDYQIVQQGRMSPAVLWLREGFAEKDYSTSASLKRYQL